MFLLIYKTYCDDYDTDITTYKTRQEAVKELNNIIKDAFGEDVDFDNEKDDAGTLLKNCGNVGKFYMTDYEYIISQKE